MRVVLLGLVGTAACPTACSVLFDFDDVDDQATDSGQAVDADLDTDADTADRDADTADRDADTGVDAPWCRALFDDAQAFALCAEDAESCTFYQEFVTASSCETVCTAHGGACLAAGNDENEVCTNPDAFTCGEVDEDLICTCSRPR